MYTQPAYRIQSNIKRNLNGIFLVGLCMLYGTMSAYNLGPRSARQGNTADGGLFYMPTRFTLGLPLKSALNPSCLIIYLKQSMDPLYLTVSHDRIIIRRLTVSIG